MIIAAQARQIRKDIEEARGGAGSAPLAVHLGSRPGVMYVDLHVDETGDVELWGCGNPWDLEKALAGDPAGCLVEVLYRY